LCSTSAPMPAATSGSPASSPAASWTVSLVVRDPPRRLLFGERSYGSSGNARPIDLGNGVIVALPS
jgi:hypothetical protein